MKYFPNFYFFAKYRSQNHINILCFIISFSVLFLYTHRCLSISFLKLSTKHQKECWVFWNAAKTITNHNQRKCAEFRIIAFKKFSSNSYRRKIQKKNDTKQWRIKSRPHAEPPETVKKYFRSLIGVSFKRLASPFRV